MVRVGSEPVWQLSRGQTLYSRISDRELLLRAEAGHQPGDLRRPGLGGWRSAESLPDVLDPPHRPPGQSLITQLKPRLMQRQGALIGLLIAAIFVGSIDVAMRTYFATSATEVSAKIQDRLIAADLAKAVQKSISLAAAKPLQTSEPLAPKPGSDITGVEVFSVSNIHPTDGFVIAPARHPASASESDSAISSTSASQSRTAAEPHLVPLTKRKPKRPIAKEARSNTAELKAMGVRQEEPRPKPMRQEEQGPKPMAFGSIGYSYNPQQ
jgi:hypothetical protein